MQLTPVESSTIKAIGYEPERSKLTIEFKKGGTYQYSPITEECHRELMASDSKGSYFAQNIKNNELVFCKKLDT